MTRRLTFSLAACLALAASANAQSVSLRTAPQAPLPGKVTSISLRGVEVESSSVDTAGNPVAVRTLIALDLVGPLNAVPPSPTVARALEVGTQLMRVRSRLERGDEVLAQTILHGPLLAALQPDFASAEPGTPRGPDSLGGPTALLLTECRLRSHLAGNATGSATLSWLQWRAIVAQRPTEPSSARTRWLGGATSLGPIVDSATGLCPQLPPIFARFTATPGADAVRLRPLIDSQQLLEASRAPGVSPLIPAAYSLAAKIAAGTLSPSDTVALPPPTSDLGDQLVHDIVAAQTAPSDPMRAARARLVARLAQFNREEQTRESADELAADPPAGAGTWWQRAWLHAAIGRSLLAEDDAALQRQGVVELLHVPALEAHSLPALSATALLDVLNHFRAGGVGDSPAARAAIELELRTRFGTDPGHAGPPEPQPGAHAPRSAPRPKGDKETL